MDKINLKLFLDNMSADTIYHMTTFISAPYDIYKILYYNKHRLYLSNNTKTINKTTDNLQLLLWSLFYEKMMYQFKKRIDDFELFQDMLSDNMVISGSKILECFYDDNYENTEYSIEFFFKEYPLLFQENGPMIMNVSNTISDYIKNGITIENKSDTDIFILSNDKTFRKPQMEYFNFMTNKFEFVHCYLQPNKKIILVICVEHKDEVIHLNLDKISHLYPHYEKNIDECYIYKSEHQLFKCSIQYFISKDNENCIKLDIDSNKIYEMPENILQYHKYISYVYSDGINDTYNLDHEYDCLEKKLLEKYKLISTVNLHNQLEYYKRKDNSKKRFSDNRYGNICVTDYFTKTWYESYYDIIVCGNANSNNEHPIISTKFENDNNKIINLVHVNSNIFKSVKENIDNFDIDICKQIFNGNKLVLTSLNGLINKKFTYVPKNIKNALGYVTSMKRINKYIARGFNLIDADNVIRELKEYYDIPKIPSKNFLNKNNKMAIIDTDKKLFEYVTLAEYDPLGWLSLFSTNNN
ncbi:hypothetical protein Catovirus_1_216 [Catovirus CTV1]|uniref:Uncharacterized protein n=1 Tax=Catovirus CTV1 TaxID=1977631 RepID=A0A1V0S8Z2_9VIRU|nr:hypothetical protein Catovirus_1_216 [Catovirus CTV1]